jgi:hypothetical protein
LSESAEPPRVVPPSGGAGGRARSLRRGAARPGASASGHRRFSVEVWVAGLGTDRGPTMTDDRMTLFRPVHVRTLRSQHRRMLLSARKLLQEKAIAFENDSRGAGEGRLYLFDMLEGIVGEAEIEAVARKLEPCGIHLEQLHA